MLPTIGDRIRMTGLMPDDPSPIPVGTEGTVTNVIKSYDESSQIWIDWDIPRNLMVLDTDPFIIL